HVAASAAICALVAAWGGVLSPSTAQSPHTPAPSCGPIPELSLYCASVIDHASPSSPIPWKSSESSFSRASPPPEGLTALCHQGPRDGGGPPGGGGPGPGGGGPPPGRGGGGGAAHPARPRRRPGGRGAGAGGPRAPPPFAAPPLAAPPGPGAAPCRPSTGPR